VGFAGEQSNAVLRRRRPREVRPRNGGPLPAPRNRKYGINFTSRGFGDKILKFYLLKYNKCSMLSKRCGVKFEILQRKRRLCNARSASVSQILNLG